jgi:hypothetical protein
VVTSTIDGESTAVCRVDSVSGGEELLWGTSG